MIIQCNAPRVEQNVQQTEKQEMQKLNPSDITYKMMMLIVLMVLMVMVMKTNLASRANAEWVPLPEHSVWQAVPLVATY